MAEQSPTKQPNDRTVAMPVQLKADHETSRPALANYVHVSVAEGLVYLDFGFLEPALLSAVLKRAQQGVTLPRQLEGRVATRVALPFDALVRLHQQLSQVVKDLQRIPTAQS
ncbi:MAG: hypothetical protein OJF47_003871 [Nitrospira sp.]|jgi:hypothetical protein|nr:MAG: hypothetical protein OJF47_003871 [Nitrospira sp.]